MTRSMTIILMLLVVGGLVAWDIFAMIHAGVPATISGVLYDSAHKEPILPFAFGLLIGHWFWGVYD